MRNRWLLLPLATLVIAACQDGGAGGAGKSSDTTKAKLDSISQLDSVSYVIGQNLGDRARGDSVKLNPDMLVRGFNDAYANKGALTDSQMNAVMASFQTTLQKEQAERANKAGAANEEKGKKFLEENKKKEGVIELPSGLQYKILTPGTGKSPGETDQVQVLYKGRLMDGTVFDSATDRSAPATFYVAGVIPGWTEALKMMQEGAKWEVYIPGKLAYGIAPPPGGKIEPNSLLIFEVELVKVLPPTATPSGGSK